MSAAIIPVSGQKILPEMDTNQAMVILSKDTDPKSYLDVTQKNVVIYVIGQTWKRTLVNSAIGAGIGGAIGGGVGFLVAGPAGIIPGAAIGAAAGGVAGAVITISLSTAFYPLTVKIDPVYHNWKQLIIRENLLKSFDAAVLEHEELRGLQCPILCDFPVIPVRAPCGHIYDKASIERHIDFINSKVELIAADRLDVMHDMQTCPSRRPGIFQKDQLEYVPEHLDKIIHACVKVNSIIGSGHENLILRQGLELAYLQSVNTYTKISSARACSFFERTSAEIKEGKSIDRSLFGIEMANLLPPEFPKMQIRVVDKDEKLDK